MHTIPKNELKFSFARSRGKGGQNVNKVETKVTVRWDFEKSLCLSKEEKNLIRIRLANRLDSLGRVAVSAQTERMQRANRARAIELLERLVRNALRVVPKRKRTRIPRAEKERRLREKQKVAEKKKLRRKVGW